VGPPHSGDSQTTVESNSVGARQPVIDARDRVTGRIALIGDERWPDMLGHAVRGADVDPGPLGESLLGRPSPDQAVKGGSFGWADHQLGRGRMGHVIGRICDRRNGLVISVLMH
jgi:hypothetical protein